ncbi:copper amine oxidase N-terminal domain-containing protein [Ureibacillus sp. GCM10028918]|uniref:copper amine oxidase N-terminal domain-containing protein n=1 Tax=Ureibacillus sp. GCM10028918 TaxID=3273429 RepID=UPI0036199890
MNNNLKKFGIVTILVAMSLFMFSHEKAFANQHVGNGIYLKNNVTIVVNGKRVTFNAPIVNKSGSLFLPMRDFYEVIGATVSWDKKTLTASAVKDGSSVDVTLNSKRAKVNGKTVSVNVAPFIYKNRTYVPIRFLSENFGGDVIWNSKSQRVDITFDGQQPTEPEIKDPYYLHINNKRIIMDDPILSRLGRTYIPAEYFYENLENSSGKWITDQQFELQVSGLIFVFTNGSNTVQVNNESVVIDEKPFKQSDKMYVPVHFIVNAFGSGGNLRYLEKQKEMYIYLYEYMFTSEFLEKSYGSTKVPQLTPSASLTGNRTLLVSDNPETLTPNLISNSTATLSQQVVQSSNAVNEHRVFGWHHNTLGKDIDLGITIENTSSTTSLQVTKSEGVSKISGNSWINYDIGLPIANQVLNGKLNQSASSGITIAPGETKIIESYDLYNTYIIGFLHDLDVQPVGGNESSYIIRTVLSKSGEDLTTVHSDPVPINPQAPHPRGVWSSSVILSEFPTYTIGSSEVGYSISNGKTDHLLSEESAIQQFNGVIGNSGHFGVNYLVNIPINNPTGQPQNVKLKLSGRGGFYSGAIKINGEVYLIPTLRPGTEYIELPSHLIEGNSEVITLEVMHAGGGNLPVAIYIATE